MNSKSEISKIYAGIARAYFKSKNVYRYRMKKISDMDDDEVIEKCHDWYEENDLTDDYKIFEENFLKPPHCMET